MLGFESYGHDFRRLSLPASVEDEVGAGVMSVVPCGFYEYASCVSVAGLGYGTFPFAVSRGVLTGDQAEVGH